MKSVKAQKLIPLNIQLFAENETNNDNNGNGGSTNDNQPKTYSEQEYLKLKASFDKTASELAEAKKQAKAKMSEDEKKAQEQDEINKKLADYESKFEDYALKDELMKGNVFTSEEIENIIKEKNDKPTLLKTMVSLFNKKVEDIKKEAIAEFMKSSDVSGGFGGNNNTTDKDVQSYINSKKNDRTSKAREHFLK